MTQVRGIFKNDFGKFEDAASLDVNLIVSVHQNVGDRLILQERLEGSEAEHFVQHLAADSLPFRAAEGDIRRGNQIVDYRLHLGL